MRNAVRSKNFITRALVSAALLSCAPQVFALSDTTLSAQNQENPAPGEAPLRHAFEGVTTPDAPSPPEGETTAEEAPAVKSAEGATADSNEAPPAEIIRDLSTLPEPVRQMRERIVEAAASGDIERLRPLIEGTPKPPQIMNGDSDDPIDTLKNFSGDSDGQEILAIMLDILSTGAARLDAGTAEETYVWPYFVGKSLSTLTPPERVDLLRIVTAGDLMGMEENGNYNFYRLGISPDGQWKFMAGGD